MCAWFKYNYCLINLLLWTDFFKNEIILPVSEESEDETFV